MSCLNPTVGTLLKGTRLKLVHVATCLRIKLAEATDTSSCLRLTDRTIFFLNLLAPWGHTSLCLILSVARPLLTVHTGVVGCLIASIWSKPYLLQCDVYGTLSSWRELKQLKNLNETAKAVSTVPGSWAGSTSEVQIVTKSHFFGSWRYWMQSRLWLLNRYRKKWHTSTRNALFLWKTVGN